MPDEQQDQTQDQQDEPTIYVDGAPYQMSDLSWLERDQVEQLVNNHVPAVDCRACEGRGVLFSPNGNSAPTVCPICGGEGHRRDTRPGHYVAGIVAVVRQRTSPDFTFKDALKSTERESAPPPKAPAKAKKTTAD